MIEWRGATAMLAGHPTSGKELAAACRVATEEFTSASFDALDLDLAVTALLEKYRLAARVRKQQILEHFIGIRLGISLKEFLALPSENHLDVCAEFSHQTLGADILICSVT
ncbi:MAG TPA: hypothetical protein VGP62_05110, partial [Bryobacteraceae bacterium]|nr:hypothetical protein [Bryobacteraceae bacterium]